jgi:hypothetical protein
VCEALGWRVEPLAGFILFGVLWNVWLTTMAFTAGLFAGVGIGRAIGAGEAAIGTALGILAGAASVLFFVRWTLRKRAGAKRLIRDGTIADGKVADKADQETAQLAARVAFIGTRRSYAGVAWYRVNFLDGINGYYVYVPFPKAPAAGAKIPVMFVPDYKYALGFDSEGRAYPCKLHRS